MPEKILFGTDASPSTPEVSWEESAWTTNKNAPEALAIALTGMIQSGSITRARATELAQMVLRENARTLYKLQGEPAAINLLASHRTSTKMVQVHSHTYVINHRSFC